MIASPEFGEGIFYRAVVLLCEHGAAGSFGLIINKPLDADLPLDILQIDQLSNAALQLRASGPVQTSQMMLVHTSDQIPEQTIEICSDVNLGGDLPFLQHAASSSGGPPMLLCFGYAAWGAGELEREFMDGVWYLTPASKRHVFETPPEQLWRALLHEMGGRYASLSTIPEDLSLN